MTDDTSASFTLNLVASGGDSIKNVASQYKALSESLKVTKTELQEAGLKGSSLMKTLADTKVLSTAAAQSFGAYQAAVKQFGANSATAGTAAQRLAKDLKYLAQEEASLKWVTADATASLQKQKDILAQTKAEDAWINKQKQMGSASSALGGQLKGLILQYAGLAAILTFMKSSFDAAMNFDEQLDKISVSSSKMGISFKEAGERLHSLALTTSRTSGYDINGAGGKQSIFDESQVLTAIEKFRDSGFNVFAMTQEQLKPVLDAAVATAQDLGQVSEAANVALSQFSMTMDDTGKVADIMVNAFKESGMTADEFAASISAAGVAARASGTDLAEYTAVVVRLKQLGIDNGAGFQKIFFAALNAPSATQLKAFSDAGVSPYKSSSSFGTAGTLDATKSIGAVSSFADRLGFPDVADSIQKARMEAAQFLEQFNAPLAEAAANVERVQKELVALAIAQEQVDSRVVVYDTLVTSLKSKLDGLKASQAEWKARLDETTTALAETTKEIDGLTSLALPGMHAFDVSIEKADLAAKRLQLQMLRTEESTESYEDAISSLNDQVKQQERATDAMKKGYDDVGTALEKAKAKASGLEAALQKLRNPELAGEQAFTDAQFGIQQQITALNLRKSSLDPADMFGGNAIDAQIAALQKQLEQSRLSQSLTFDPQRKAIEDAARDSDRRTGKSDAPTTAEDAIKRIDRLTERSLRQEKKVSDLTRERQREARALQESQDATDALKDRVLVMTDAMEKAKAATKEQADALKALQQRSEELKLEKAVQYGQALADIKEAQYQLKQELGLAPKETPFDTILATIPTLKAEYQKLAAQRDEDQRQLQVYDTAVSVTSENLRDYEGKLAAAKQTSVQLTEETKRLEEQFAVMPKVYKSEIEILDELSGRVLNTGLAYDLLGKKGGAALAALIGEKGENVGKLKELADVLGSQGSAASSASDASSSLFDEAQALKAAFNNLKIEIGTGLAESMTGLTGALTKLTNIMVNWLGEPGGAEWSDRSTLSPEMDARAKKEGLYRPNTQSAPLFGMQVPSWMQINAFASGGIVPGVGTRDTVPAMLTPGEEVITRKDPRHRANGGGVTVAFYGDVNVRNDQDIDRLADVISRRLAGEVRRSRAGMA